MHITNEKIQELVESLELKGATSDEMQRQGQLSRSSSGQRKRTEVLMQDAMVHISEEGGQLRRVLGAYVTNLDPGEAPMLRGVLLEFERGRLAVLVTDDDELTVAEGFDEHALNEDLRASDLGNLSPWKESLGASVLWAWRMTNQQGYADGVQFELSSSTSTASVTVQLLAIAGEIKVRKVEE